MNTPALSVVIPTFNNRAVLERCLDHWRRYAESQPVEILVIEDGCRDGTPAYLNDVSRSEWGRRQLRWFHEDNVHELKCTNRGFAEARAPLVLSWQDDMFLQCRWFVEEMAATFAAYPDIGLLSLSRGLLCIPSTVPLRGWEDLIDIRRLESTIGPSVWNWICLQEVDAVIRPWVVRRACLDRVGLLDEAFCPTEWDEADLCFRIRRSGWKIATHGYERLGVYRHLGSATLARTGSEPYRNQVLANGIRFHRLWDETILRERARPRRRWWRRSPLRGWTRTARKMCASIPHFLGSAGGIGEDRGSDCRER